MPIYCARVALRPVSSHAINYHLPVQSILYSSADLINFQESVIADHASTQYLVMQKWSYISGWDMPYGGQDSSAARAKFWIMCYNETTTKGTYRLQTRKNGSHCMYAGRRDRTAMPLLQTRNLKFGRKNNDETSLTCHITQKTFEIKCFLA